MHVPLVKDEYIQELSLDFTVGKPFLTGLLIQTNIRPLGPYGGQGGQTFTVKGSKLLYMDGRSGPLVNQLTAYYDKCLPI